jgi:hypothetical protein
VGVRHEAIDMLIRSDELIRVAVESGPYPNRCRSAVFDDSH